MDLSNLKSGADVAEAILLAVKVGDNGNYFETFTVKAKEEDLLALEARAQELGYTDFKIPMKLVKDARLRSDPYHPPTSADLRLDQLQAEPGQKPPYDEVSPLIEAFGKAFPSTGGRGMYSADASRSASKDRAVHFRQNGLAGCYEVLHSVGPMLNAEQCSQLKAILERGFPGIGVHVPSEQKNVATIDRLAQLGRLPYGDDGLRSSIGNMNSPAREAPVAALRALEEELIPFILEHTDTSSFLYSKVEYLREARRADMFAGDDKEGYDRVKADTAALVSNLIGLAGANDVISGKIPENWKAEFKASDKVSNGFTGQGNAAHWFMSPDERKIKLSPLNALTANEPTIMFCVKASAQSEGRENRERASVEVTFAMAPDGNGLLASASNNYEAAPTRLGNSKEASEWLATVLADEVEKTIAKTQTNAQRP